MYVMYLIPVSYYLSLTWGFELQSSERLKKCSQSSSAATLAAMLNAFLQNGFRTVFCEVMGTGSWDRRVHDVELWLFRGTSSNPNQFWVQRSAQAEPLVHIQYTISEKKCFVYTVQLLLLILSVITKVISIIYSNSVVWGLTLNPKP
jgi:hypothetical protein